SDEDWNGQGYGVLTKETRPDGTYKTFSDYYAGTSQPRYVAEYAADGTLLATYEYAEDGTLIGTSEPGVTYTYYPSGLLKTKELDAPDTAGNVAYEYLDEDYNSQGYGRLKSQKRDVTNAAGELTFSIEYAGAGELERTVYTYSDEWTTLVNRYEYDASGVLTGKYDYATNEYYTYYGDGLMASKTLPTGTVYEYSDEDWNGQGYGVLTKETRPDGTYKTFSDYYAGTSQPRYVAEYAADGTWLATYEYDASGNLVGVEEPEATYTYFDSGRVKTKTLADGTVYEYSDENWNGTGIGVLVKETRPDGTYKTFSDYYAGTSQPRYVAEYAADGTLLVSYEYHPNGELAKKIQSNGYIFEYYESGNLKSSIYPKVGTYEYMDEDFQGAGYGRLIKDIKADGSYTVYSGYYPDSAQFGKKEEYDRKGVLVEAYEYYENGVISKKTVRDGSIYEYDEQGRLRRSVTSDGFEYTFDEDGRMVSQKYPDGAYLEDIVDLVDGTVSRFIYSDESKSILLKIEIYDYSTDPADYSSWTFVEQIDPTGYTSVRDGLGRVTEEGVPGLYTMTYSYYESTSLVSSKTFTDLANGKTIVYEYDPLARLTREVLNGDIEVFYIYYGSTKTTYKVLGRSVSDPNDIKFTCEYRDDGSLMERITYGVDTVISRYDREGRLKYLNVEGKSETTFIYDPETGKLLKKAVKDLITGNTLITEYLDNGKISRVTDLSGYVYFYDEQGRLVREDDVINNVRTYYGYADNDNMNFSYKRVYEYDLGRFTVYIYDTTGQITDSNMIASTIEGYDLATGRLMLRAYVDGSSEEYTYFGDTTDIKTITYKDKDGRETVETYDQDGRLVKEEKWNDLVTNYTYDTYGRLTLKESSDGTSEEYIYWNDTNVMKKRTVVSRWNTTTIEEYNELGQLVKTTYKYRWSTYTSWMTYSYDAAGNLIRKDYSYGSHEEYEYWAGTSIMKNKKYIDSAGHTSTYEYNELGNVTKYTSYYGYTVSYTYDALNRLTRTDSSSNSHTINEYFGDTNKIKKTTSYYNGNVNYVVEYEYYGDSDMLKSRTYKYSSGYYYKYEYDPVTGGVIKVSGPNGYDTYYEYDSLDRITRIDYAYGYTCIYEYYGNSEVHSKVIYVDEEGRTTVYEYLPDGQISHMEYDGYTVDYTYDTLGRLIRTDNSDGSYSERTYYGDTYKTLTYVNHYSDGTSYSYAYTYYSNGYTQTYTYTDRAGKTTVYQYSSNGRVDTITYSDGKVATYTYNSDGRTSRIDYSTGGYRTYEYYSNGYTKKTLEHFVDGTETTDEYTYYSGSNYWRRKTYKHTDRNGDYVLYEYDSNSKLTKVTRGNGATVELVETYTYDASGRKTRVDYSNGAYDTYAYVGATSRIDRIDRYSSTGEHTYEEYTYFNDVFGDSGVCSYTIGYADGTFKTTYYDVFGTILKELMPDGTTVYYSAYDDLGRVTRKDMSDGTFVKITYVGDTSDIEEVMEYYVSGRMHTKTLADGTIYEYSDEDWNSEGYGVLTKETRPDGTYKTFSDYYAGTRQAKYISEYAADGTWLATYEYDASGNLVGTEQPDATYTYYASGRMHTKTLA
ncbi:MAG: hypothetical protein PHQ61_06060, partial [Candidatus Omnitrophica bacterium]|nr:hypothetical protein [Candidatus Omnitrophota bacterium]